MKAKIHEFLEGIKDSWTYHPKNTIFANLNIIMKR